MKEAAESHFSVFMAVENQPIVEARHEQIPGGMFRVSLTPNRTNVGMVGEQHNGPIHCINKSLSRRRIRFGQVQRLTFEIPFELRALRDGRQRFLRVRRATN